MASKRPAPAELSGGDEQPPPETISPPDDPIHRFRDIPIEISVQLDRKRVRVEDVLNFQVNSVIELSRSAGENVDLLLDGEIVGNGEIVVIEDTMGLRVTDLGDASEQRRARG